MPDGDILRLGIKMNGPFCGAYEQICQGVSPEDIAYKIAQALSKHIQNYGCGPRNLLKRMLPVVTQMAQQSTPIQPQQLKEFGRRLTNERQQVGGQRDGLDIAADALTRAVYDIQQGQVTDDVEHKLARSFIDKVLDCAFDERIRTSKKQFDDTPLAVIQTRRQELDPYLERHLEHFAKQLLNDDASRKMRRAPTKRAKQDAGVDDVIE